MRGRGATATRRALAAAGAILVVLGAGASPAPAFPAAAMPLTAIEGSPFAAPVATFSDGVAVLGIGCASPAQYSATIVWGDGASTPGSVSGGTGGLLGPCVYAVAGAHTYAEDGRTSYSVAIAGPAGNGGGGPAAVVVVDAPLNATASGFAAVQNAPATVVATFTDTNPGATAADFSATISWGDGTSGAGTVAAASSGGFVVTATHTYTSRGSFTVSVRIADAGSSQATAVATATVAAAPATAPPNPPPGTPPPGSLRLGLSSPVLARGGTIILGVRCPVAARLCRGRLSVATVGDPRSRLGALRRAQTLGTTLFIIPGGRRAELSVRPKRAVVALLRRAGSVRVAANASSVDAATGRSQVANLTARLELARGGRRAPTRPRHRP